MNPSIRFNTFSKTETNIRLGPIEFLFKNKDVAMDDLCLYIYVYIKICIYINIGV